MSSRPDRCPQLLSRNARLETAPRDAEATASHVLWTGGWDSTFRVLALLFIHKAPVQPHYIIDATRKSYKAELRAMEEIRRAVLSECSEVHDLFLPLHAVQRSEVMPNAAISTAYRRLREQHFLGKQFEWLARYAYQEQIEKLDLCIEASRHIATTDLCAMLGRFVVPVRLENGETTLEFNRSLRGTPEGEVFSRFRFPLLELTKLAMRRIAAEFGFLSYLERSWFCHSPLGDGAPCGTCGPCVYTVKDGLGARLPIRSRLRYHLSIKRRLRAFLRRRPRIYNSVESLRRHWKIAANRA